MSRKSAAPANPVGGGYRFTLVNGDGVWTELAEGSITPDLIGITALLTGLVAMRFHPG